MLASPRRVDGQAASEYVVLLLLVAAALAVGAAAVLPGVGERVIAAVRVGICIVGGDICRDRDAKAAGLAPCMTRSREKGAATTLEVAVVRGSEYGTWTMATHSDGSVAVTRLDRGSTGLTGGVGASFSPIGIDVGVSGKVELQRHGGATWRFRTPAAATAFLRRRLGPKGMVPDRVAPTERWIAGGAGATGSIGASTDQPGLGAGGDVAVEQALGRRTGGGRTTWFFQAGLDGPRLFVELPGLETEAGGRDALIELTSDRSGVRELVLRTVRRDGRRIEELTGRLDLRSGPGREAVRAALAAGARWPPAALRRLGELMRTTGIVERHVFDLDDRSRSVAAGARLVAALGFEHTRVDVVRRLASADVWVDGVGPRKRADCVGL